MEIWTGVIKGGYQPCLGKDGMRWARRVYRLCRLKMKNHLLISKISVYPSEYDKSGGVRELGHCSSRNCRDCHFFVRLKGGKMDPDSLVLLVAGSSVGILLFFFFFKCGKKVVFLRRKKKWKHFDHFYLLLMKVGRKLSIPMVNKRKR